MERYDKQIKKLIAVLFILLSAFVFFKAFYTDSDVYFTENLVSEVSSIEKININTASAEEISSSLYGIGDVLAQRIVEYREKNGSFKSIDELMNVKGIGEKKLEKVKDYIIL